MDYINSKFIKKLVITNYLILKFIFNLKLKLGLKGFLFIYHFSHLKTYFKEF